jgi:hypothetical protein
MAAITTANRSISSLLTERRFRQAGAPLTAASPVDAAFVDLEPGASVASYPSLGADDAGAARGDRGRHPAAARGVRPLLAILHARRPVRRRARLRISVA